MQAKKLREVHRLPVVSQRLRWRRETCVPPVVTLSHHCARRRSVEPRARILLLDRSNERVHRPWLSQRTIRRPFTQPCGPWDIVVLDPNANDARATRADGRRQLAIASIGETGPKAFPF